MSLEQAFIIFLHGLVFIRYDNENVMPGHMYLFTLSFYSLLVF